MFSGCRCCSRPVFAVALVMMSVLGVGVGCAAPSVPVARQATSLTAVKATVTTQPQQFMSGFETDLTAMQLVAASGKTVNGKMRSVYKPVSPSPNESFVIVNLTIAGLTNPGDLPASDLPIVDPKGVHHNAIAQQYGEPGHWMTFSGTSLEGKQPTQPMNLLYSVPTRDVAGATLQFRGVNHPLAP